jgi:hypothetical protein
MRKAWIPVATRRKERRDHKRAHKANGRTVKVPAGTGGTPRGLRLFEELCMFIPVRPHTPDQKNTPADLWGRGWSAGAAS